MDTAYYQDQTSEVPAEPGGLAMGPDDMSPTEKANLAASMTAEMRKVIGRKCHERYRADLASREPRMKRQRDLQRMYALVPEAKNFPFHKAANVKTPSLTGPVLQIEARLYDMMWPATGKVFTVIPGTAEEQQEAFIAEKFANSYVRYKMPYMSQGLGDTMHQMCLYGSAFRRTYWDGLQHAVRSDWIPIEDFVVNYKIRSQDPSMSDVRRYSMRHWMTGAELRAHSEDGIFIDVEEALKYQPTDDTASEFKQQADKIDGQESSEEPLDADDDIPRPVVEQHCVWKLPNQPNIHPSFDGKEHFCVIVFDCGSGKVLRMSLREEDDPDDKRRFDRQMAAHQQYQMEKLRFDLMAQAQAAAAQSMSMGPQADGPPDTTLGPGMAAPEEMASPEAPPEMEPPEAVPPPSAIRKRQICFFTHYRCFSSDGFYGLGYGDVLYGLALAENTILNQHIDGVTLKNSKPMFMSRQTRMQRGSVTVQPGEAIEIDAPAGSIRDAIMFLDPPQNDPTTVPLVKLLDSMKDSMAGSSDMMSGQGPGSNQTKAGLQILSEQAMTPITVLARRTKESFRHELDKIWRCFGVFLEDEEIADVVAEGGQAESIKIGKAMFSPTARLVPASDPRLKTQRLDDHMALFQYCMNNPLIAKNPQVGPAVLGKLTEAGFRLFPDGEQLIPLLTPPQPPPPPPPQPKEQWQENAGFMVGQDSPVLPVDNDDVHIQQLQEFMASPDAQAMEQMGRGMAENHLRHHISQRIMKRGQALAQQRQAVHGPIPGGNAPMAGVANNPAPQGPPQGGM